MAIVDMIYYCMNYSIYYWGQLIMMGWQVGLGSFFRMDFIYYVGLFGE